MNRTILSAAAAASCLFAAPALAQEAPAASFIHEGMTFDYTATQQGRSRVIEGKNSDGVKFRLVVHNGRVDGYFDDRHVSFAVPRKSSRSGDVAAR